MKHEKRLQHTRTTLPEWGFYYFHTGKKIQEEGGGEGADLTPMEGRREGEGSGEGRHGDKKDWRGREGGRGVHQDSSDSYGNFILKREKKV